MADQSTWTLQDKNVKRNGVTGRLSQFSFDTKLPHHGTNEVTLQNLNVVVADIPIFSSCCSITCTAHIT